MSKTYVYSAQDNLETMQDAVNYNRYQHDFIYKEIQRVHAGSILDFGAGIGTYADMLQPDGLTIDCVELDPNHVAILQDKGYKVYTDIRTVPTKYDIIYSLNVLEHIEDDTAILQSLADTVSDKGEIVIFVPAFKLIWTGLDDKAEHLRRYRISDMKRLAKATGLEIKSIKYCDPAGFFGALVYRMIGGNGTLTPGSVKFFDRVAFPIGVALETVFKKILGKNVLVVFTKPQHSNV